MLRAATAVSQCQPSLNVQTKLTRNAPRAIPRAMVDVGSVRRCWSSEARGATWSLEDGWTDGSKQAASDPLGYICCSCTATVRCFHAGHRGREWMQPMTQMLLRTVRDCR